MTRNINSVLIATMLLATFATTTMTVQAFAQQSGNPNGQGQGQGLLQQQQLQVQLPNPNGQGQGQGLAVQQQQVLQQLPVEPIVGNIEIPFGDIANNGAIANSQAFQRAAAQSADGSLIALQLQNTNVAIPVAADVDANVCGVSVLAEPAPVTCQTTPNARAGQ